MAGTTLLGHILGNMTVVVIGLCSRIAFITTARLVMSRAVSYKRLKMLLRLKVGVFVGDVLEAGAFLRGIQVAVTYNQGLGVTLVQLLEQSAE